MTQFTSTPNNEVCQLRFCCDGNLLAGHKNSAYTPDNGTGKKPSVCPTCGSNNPAYSFYAGSPESARACPDPFHTSQAPMPGSEIKNQPRTVLCDIDGTLAHKGDRSPFDWHAVGNDTLDLTIQRLLLALGQSNEIVFISGRDEVCRPETEEWLQRYGWLYQKLFMRPANDMRKDSIVKREIYEQHIKNQYKVFLVLDDRDQVVSMWRNELGLKCLQVAEGNF